MVGIETSIAINASPEKVWEMLALDRLPEWMDEMEMKSGKYSSKVNAPEDKYRVGAIAHIIEKRWEYDLEITQSIENEKMTIHSIGKYKYTMTWNLKPFDGGTELTWMAEVEMPWGILGRALGVLARRSGEKQGKRALEKLKNIVEK